ncbi:MAG TPA: DUF2950 family protein [Planctomycetota bacterium]|nr:DUF2950 family protein [Planctomycetota bacterium]
MRAKLVILLLLSVTLTAAEDVQGLLKKLTGENVDARIAAAKALGEIGAAAKPAVPALAAAVAEIWSYKKANEEKVSDDETPFEEVQRIEQHWNKLIDLRKSALAALQKLGPAGAEASCALLAEIEEFGMADTVEVHSKIAPDRIAELNEALAAVACRRYESAQATHFNIHARYFEAPQLSAVVLYASPEEYEVDSKAFAEAFGEPGKIKPYNGYGFKMLFAQGEHAKGAGKRGKASFRVDGQLTNGHAIIAYPAEYGKTGRVCYVISDARARFKKDLGATTAAMVSAMTEYNPDSTWKKLEPERMDAPPRRVPEAPKK